MNAPFPIAPGHPYNPNTGTGIEVTPSHLKLWGVTAPHVCHCEVENPNLSASAFFGSLLHGEMFPAVEYWWFDSPWTQMVKVTVGTAFANSTSSIGGTLEFALDPDHAGSWYINTDPNTLETVVFTSLPMFTSIANVPLCVQLARLVVNVASDELPANRPHIVSSLVNTADLQSVLPTTSYIYEKEAERFWQLELDTRNGIRAWWLGMYGITLSLATPPLLASSQI